VKEAPKSWADLKTGKYKVSIGDVSAAAQAVNGVLAAAIANGGNEKNIQPGLDFFAEIAKQGRLSLSNPTIQTLEKGEVEVGIVWDFNGLSYRDQIDPSRFDVLIPADGSVISGYTTIINKYAKNPNAVKAKLLPNEQYAKVQPIKDAKAWEETSKALPQQWQEHVIIEME
jgi:putative spermidine/putrescine transport system substrate-binding protein